MEMTSIVRDLSAQVALCGALLGTASAAASGGGFAVANRIDHGVDPLLGMFVCASDGTLTKELTLAALSVDAIDLVASLSVDSIDVVADGAHGSAPPGAVLEVTAFGPGTSDRIEDR